jgi:hypothetical protein
MSNSLLSDLPEPMGEHGSQRSTDHVKFVYGKLLKHGWWQNGPELDGA